MANYRLPENVLDDPHVQQLLAFGEDVFLACDHAGVSPILDGSVAVLAYTHDPAIKVGDLDLNCPEAVFPQLQAELENVGIACVVHPWRIMHAIRDGMKAEFGASEEWLKGVYRPFERLPHPGNRSIDMVAREDLIELYRRGYVATTDSEDEPGQHEHIASRLRSLGVDY